MDQLCRTIHASAFHVWDDVFGDDHQPGSNMFCSSFLVDQLTERDQAFFLLDFLSRLASGALAAKREKITSIKIGQTLYSDDSIAEIMWDKDFDIVGIFEVLNLEPIINGSYELDWLIGKAIDDFRKGDMKLTQVLIDLSNLDQQSVYVTGYKIYEAIGNQWYPADFCDRLKKTANNPIMSGFASRHGWNARQSTLDPAKKLVLPNEVINETLIAARKYLINQASSLIPEVNLNKLMFFTLFLFLLPTHW
jgi:hypothetical protein